ncbi:MAG: hypothetical protein PHP93_07740 [Kiritimatiellales bacterium]|nr:hypothetical protein [Kiritimatiellales bacterium]
MDHFEKLELKKEITTEVREDITRYVGLRITSRIFYALMIIMLELCFWLFVITSVVKDNTAHQGFLTCLLLVAPRIGQVAFISMFNEK